MTEQVVRLGFLVPATNAVMEPEMYKLAPEGVTLHFERLIPKTVPGKNHTSDSLSTLFRFLEELAEDAPRAAKAVAMIHPKVIVFGCTSGSFLGGIEHEKEITRAIETAVNIPAITTSTAVVQALKELGLQKVCLISPYVESLNEKGREFLEANGFEVPIMKGLSAGPGEAALQPPEVAYNLAKSTYSANCDGVFASCTEFRTVEILDRFEKETGKPMVSANQATMWLALKKAGISQAVTGFGQLLTHLQ